MELTLIEDKNGYSLWQSPAGDEYLVIDGLDPTQVHVPGDIELFLLEHFTLFALMYWLLILLTFGYLIGRHLLKPLYERWQQGQPIFSDEQ